MTTADRPVGYRAWSPTAAVGSDADSDYVGKHRRPGIRTLSLHRMFYTARHLAKTQ